MKLQSKVRRHFSVFSTQDCYFCFVSYQFNLKVCLEVHFAFESALMIEIWCLDETWKKALLYSKIANTGFLKKHLIILTRVLLDIKLKRLMIFRQNHYQSK